MANDTPITIIGNLTSDPELTQVTSDSAVCNFTVASTPSTFDRNSNEWKEKETIFMRAAVWRDQAKNMVDSLHKGDRVIAYGYLRSNSYEVNGENRVSLQLEILEIGPSLRFATAPTTKVAKSGGGFRQQPKQQQPSAPKDDTDGWGEEPPF